MMFEAALFLSWSVQDPCEGSGKQGMPFMSVHAAADEYYS